MVHRCPNASIVGCPSYARDMTFVDRERQAMCATFLEVGPDAPTLNDGWDAYDLIAHLWVRENRAPQVLAAILDPRKSQEAAIRRAKQEHSFTDLVLALRDGPQNLSPFRIPGVNRWGNTIEYFLHHEDLRRAGNSPLPPRDFSPAHDEALWKALKMMGGFILRNSPAGVTFENPLGERFGVKRPRRIGVRGPVGELALVASGRAQAAVGVEYAGDADLVDRFKKALGY